MAGQPRHASALNERGVSLVSVLVGLTLVSTVASAVAAVGIIEYKTSRDYLGVTESTLVADAAAAHALALLRGPLQGYTYSELLLGSDGQAGGGSCGISYRIKEVSNSVYDTTYVKPVGCFDEDLDGLYDANDDCACAGQPTGSGDDGVLAGYPELTEPDELPATGAPYRNGVYRVRLINDPADPSGDTHTDTNDRIMALCTGVAASGQETEVKLLLAAPPYPALAVNGDLKIGGSPSVLGPCAGMHANGDIDVGVNLTVDGDVTATGTVYLQNHTSLVDASGQPVQPRSGADPIEVPRLNPLDYCGEADYLLRDGWLAALTSAPDSFYLGGRLAALGWSWDPKLDLYSYSGEAQALGTVCAHGNVDFGAQGTTGEPVPISILATGSIKLNGSAQLAPSHPDNILLLAGGDVMAAGQTGAYYSGLLYAGSQCKLSGQAVLDIQMLCYDGPPPAGAINLFDFNTLAANSVVSYDCSGMRQATQALAWWY